MPVTRPSLLQFSLRSALIQSFADFEVIVSDNSKDGCEEIVRAFGDPRIRYVRPTAGLPVVGSWDFAFSAARGDIQLLLCDDDAIAPNLLAIVADAFRRYPEVSTVSWLYGGYLDENHWIASQRCTYSSVYCSGEETLFSTRDLLTESFQSGTGKFGPIKHKLPMIPFAALRRDLVERIRAAFGGSLFLPICPMMSSGLAALALTERHLRLSLPLSVFGSTIDSAAAHAVNATTFNQMTRGSEIIYAPIKLMSVFPSGVADTVLRVQHAMPALLGQYSLNAGGYFLACYVAIDEMRAQGKDVTVELEAFGEALRQMSPQFQKWAAEEPAFRNRTPVRTAGDDGARPAPLVRSIFECALLFGTHAEAIHRPERV